MPRNFDRFQGVTEDELYQRSLNDVIDFDLDIIIVNICPGLYSVFKGHHYSGPGNHFWRCLQLSGLLSKVIKSTDDYKLLEYKIGLVNMMQKPSRKSCQDLDQSEIRQAQENLDLIVKKYRPKIVAFNGKSIYEIYLGTGVDKEFNFGKQPNLYPNTSSYLFVMPSSSARCAQLPKVIDKIPFYLALKKLRDFLTNKLSELNDLEIMFPDFKIALDVHKEEEHQQHHRKSQSNHNNSNSSSNVSDSEDSVNGDNSMNNSGLNQIDSNSGRSVKFVRLNNIPFSEIPQDILANLKKQRQLRKNVTITTSRNIFIKSSNLNSPSNNQINKRRLSISTTATNQYSDIDTASNATNDSASSDAASLNSLGLSNNNCTDNSSNKSILTSLILNVCSANTITNATNTSSQAASNQNETTTIKHQSHHKSFGSNTIKNITQSSMNQSSVLGTPKSADIKPTINSNKPNVMVLNNNTNNSQTSQASSKQIVVIQQASQQIQSANIVFISSNPTHLTTDNLNQPKLYIVSNNTNTTNIDPNLINQISAQPITILPSNFNISADTQTKQVQLVHSSTTSASPETTASNKSSTNNTEAKTNENESDSSYMSIEIIKKDNYSNDDYFTFETAQPSSSNMFHGENLFNDLNRLIKLHYTESDGFGTKRVNEDNYLDLGELESNKRYCKIELCKL